MKESAIQRSILDYLQAKGILAYRMQSGATVSSYKGRTRLVRYGVPGMADVLAFPVMAIMVYGSKLHYAVPFWIECKAPKGKQSELQKSFQAQVEAHGHRYIVARSIDDLEGLL